MRLLFSLLLHRITRAQKERRTTMQPSKDAVADLEDWIYDDDNAFPSDR